MHLSTTSFICCDLLCSKVEMALPLTLCLAFLLKAHVAISPQKLGGGGGRGGAGDRRLTGATCWVREASNSQHCWAACPFTSWQSHHDIGLSSAGPVAEAVMANSLLEACVAFPGMCSAQPTHSPHTPLQHCKFAALKLTP